MCARQASKPQLRRWIDTVGEVYAKFVIAATFAALIVLPMLGVPMLSANGQRGAFYRAMGLLTTASPCALVLVPLAYVSAIAAITSRCDVVMQLPSSHPCTRLRFVLSRHQCLAAAELLSISPLLSILCPMAQVVTLAGACSSRAAR